MNPKARKDVPLRVPRENVPEVMWEPGVLTGYRPIDQPWTYYLKSLCWIHSETVNVWTHLVLPYVILVVVYILGQGQIITWPSTLCNGSNYMQFMQCMGSLVKL